MWDTLLGMGKRLASKGIDTPLGAMTAVACGGMVAGLWFDDCEGVPELARSLPKDPSDKTLEGLELWLSCYFAGKRAKRPKVALYGSPFQVAVWEETLKIPYGSTSSYKQLAEQVAIRRGKASPRAVGSAMGRNPVSILVPCHRVLGASNRLVGYGGGLNRKKALLMLEGAKFTEDANDRRKLCGLKELSLA
jgi:methylated-DNA-[protein]-cysteine S-methyltransferase